MRTSILISSFAALIAAQSIEFDQVVNAPAVKVTAVSQPLRDYSWNTLHVVALFNYLTKKQMLAPMSDRPQ